MAILAEPTVPAERFGFVNVSQSFSQLKIKSRNVLEQVILTLDCCLGKVQECNKVVLLTDELVLDGGNVELICSRLTEVTCLQDRVSLLSVLEALRDLWVPDPFECRVWNETP